MVNPATTFLNDAIQPFVRPEMAIIDHVRLPVGTDFAPGTILGFVSSATPASAVKTLTITGTPAGGTFSIFFSRAPVLTVAYNVPTATLKTALETIFGTGNIASVTGTAGTSYVITFGGQLANIRVASFGVANAFTGGTSPAIASVDTTAGTCGSGQADAYASGNSDGTQVPKRILQCRVYANTNGGADNWVVGSDQPKSFPAFAAGIFSGADLTGLDSTVISTSGWRTFKGVLGQTGHLVGLGF